jgi:hypothetical protein
MSKDKALAVHSDKVTLWYCEGCGHSGALSVERISVHGTLDGLTEHHNALSKCLCSATVGDRGLRLIKPTEWYATIHGGAALRTVKSKNSDQLLTSSDSVTTENKGLAR